MVATEPFHILIIAPDAAQRTHLERLLRRSQLVIAEICNAASLGGAGEVLRHHSFDIILLDLGSAGGPGAEPVLQLQSRAPHVPIIVLVESEDDRRVTQAVQMGVQDCLVREQMTAALLAHAVGHAVERKKAERHRIYEILDRKQKNLEVIFDAAPLGMLLVDRQMAVVRVNETVRQMSGRDYRDIIGRDVCTALACAERGGHDEATGETPSCERCPLQHLVQKVLTDGAAIRGVELRPPLGDEGDSSPLWLAASVMPVHMEGGRHVVVALHDVTKRKRAEEELRAAMEMKSQFLSTVSHELRTPLTALKEAVTIVQDGVAGKINRDQGHFLDIAKRNIERLARLIDDVLDFQRLNAGKMQFRMERNHIAAAVEEAYVTMRPHARKDGVELVMELEPNLPAAVYDRDRIIQVLTNLISNAIKFTPAGGRVVVSARYIPEPASRNGPPHTHGGLALADSEGQGYLALSVSDTGFGIPQEDLPKVFEVFYRVQRPGKEIKGTGLGLAIVSRIVAEHGGRIEVESEPAKGSTFTVVLPLTPGPPQDALNQPADEHIEMTWAEK